MLRKVQTVETQFTRLMRIQRVTRTPSITGLRAILIKNLAVFCLCPESVGGGVKCEDDEVIYLAQDVSKQVVFRLVLKKKLNQHHCETPLYCKEGQGRLSGSKSSPCRTSILSESEFT